MNVRLDARPTQADPSPSRTVSASVSVALAGVLPVYLTGAMAVQMGPDIGLSTASLGGGATAFFGASVLASLLVGRRLQRMGWQRAMALATVGHMTAMIGISAVASSVPTLLGLLAVGGVAHAIGMPAGNVAISERVGARRRALVFSLRQSAFPVASMLAGLAVPAIALTIGWRWAFASALAAPAATLALLRFPRVGCDRQAIATDDEAARLVSPGFIAFSVAVTLGASVVNIATAFLVSGAVDAGATPSTAGRLLVYGGVAAIASRLVSGTLVDRAAARGYVPMAGLLTAGAGGFLILANGDPDLLPLAAVLALGGGTGWAGLMHFILVTEWASNPGRASASMLAFAYAGGAMAPAPFGIAAERVGFQTAWIAAAALAGLAAVFTLLAARLLARERPIPN